MCKWVFRVFVALYVAAVVLLIVGTFEMFGQQADPLSGIFLIPLGLPWTLLVDLAPAHLWPWLGAAAPLINIVILKWLCRWFAARPNHRP